MQAAIWNQPQISSTATNRQKQFEELTHVQFTGKIESPKVAVNPNTVAVFHTFSDAKTISLKEALKTSLVQVKFLTVTNEQRIMLCTQCEAKMPASARSKQTKSIDPKTTPLGGQNPNLLKVYSIDRAAWRSIRADSIISWQIHSTL
jgi:hypothetical protein